MLGKFQKPPLLLYSHSFSLCSDESINGKTLVIELETQLGERVQTTLLDLPAKTSDNTTFNSGDFSSDSNSFVIGGLRGQFERHTNKEKNSNTTPTTTASTSRTSSSEILPTSLTPTPSVQTPVPTNPLIGPHENPQTAVNSNSWKNFTHKCLRITTVETM